MPFEPDSNADATLTLAAIADRLDQLAATAELMGDDPTAGQWRAQANELRLRAMTNLDTSSD